MEFTFEKHLNENWLKYVCVSKMCSFFDPIGTAFGTFPNIRPCSNNKIQIKLYCVFRYWNNAVRCLTFFDDLDAQELSQVWCQKKQSMVYIVWIQSYLLNNIHMTYRISRARIQISILFVEFTILLVLHDKRHYFITLTKCNVVQCKW